MHTLTHTLIDMTCDLRNNILNALRAEADGNIQPAKMNVEVYLHNPVGIGEHPDVLEAIEKELAVIAQYMDELEVLNRYFPE